jgi:hypothetical protein
MFSLFTLSIILPTDSPNIHIASYSIDTSLLKDGDVIFRRGTSFISNMVLMADEESPYSHTGIIKIIDSSYYVVHSVPAENLGEKDKTKIESLTDFLIRDRATAIAIYRLNLENDVIPRGAANIAAKFAKQNIPFDSDFNLTDDSRLYCTELVWKSYLFAGIDLLDNTFDNIDIPLSEGPYILPGTLLKSKYLKLIYSINFQ